MLCFYKPAKKFTIIIVTLQLFPTDFYTFFQMNVVALKTINMAH